MTNDNQFQQRIARITEMVQQVESLADPAARAVVCDLLQTVMELHGAGLERLMELLASRGTDGDRLIEELSLDPLLANLLILHGLHPHDFETRVRAGFEKAAASVRSQGGNLELLDTGDGVVRLQLHSNGHGCGAAALQKLVEDAIYAAAPDLSCLSIEGTAESPPSAIVPLEKLLSAPRSSSYEVQTDGITARHS